MHRHELVEDATDVLRPACGVRIDEAGAAAVPHGATTAIAGDKKSTSALSSVTLVRHFLQVRDVGPAPVRGER